MGAVAMAAQGAGQLLSGIGGLQTANSNAESAHYSAMQSWANAKIAAKNAEIAGQAGAEQAAMESQKGRAVFGSIKTNQAASGIDVNTGSAAATQVSAQEISKLDAMTIRSNAAKEAYGYKVQESEFNQQGDMYRQEAKNDRLAGVIGLAGTFLGSAASDITGYEKYLQQGGLGGGDDGSSTGIGKAGG